MAPGRVEPDASRTSACAKRQRMICAIQDGPQRQLVALCGQKFSLAPSKLRQKN
jgi:hypothetical protein